MYSAPRRTFLAPSQQALRRNHPPPPYSLPSRATPDLSRNQASEKRLSVNPLDGARDQAAGGHGFDQRNDLEAVLGQDASPIVGSLF